MNGVQGYFTENFIFIMIVVSTYFIVAMKSAVDKTLKVHMVINMSLLLIMSINAFYLKNLSAKDALNMDYMDFFVSSVLYYSLKPLPMVALISMGDKNNRYNYLPAGINFILYLCYFISTAYGYKLAGIMERYYIPNYASIVTEWVYWIIFLSILNIKFYKTSNKNPLGIFLYISMLMIANIIDSSGIYPGVLIKTYAVAFLLYYLIIHVYISQQIN